MPQRSTRAGSRARRIRAGALWRRLGCAAGLALASCSIGADPGPNRTSSYRGSPQRVLEIAADLLRGQGYELTPLDADFLQLQGERTEVTRRTEGSLAQGTIVTQQVFVDASEDGAGTRVNALFTVGWRQPSGLRRTWVPESSVGRRLRDEFYAALHAEIGDELAERER